MNPSRLVRRDMAHVRGQIASAFIVAGFAWAVLQLAPCATPIARAILGDETLWTELVLYFRGPRAFRALTYPDVKLHWFYVFVVNALALAPLSFIAYKAKRYAELARAFVHPQPADGTDAADESSDREE
jgi:hypothetical protein